MMFPHTNISLISSFWIKSSFQPAPDENRHTAESWWDKDVFLAVLTKILHET